MNIVNVKRLLSAEFEDDLLKTYGPLIYGENLVSALGFSSKVALQRAVKAKKVPVPVFKIDGSKENYAFAKDIAQWFADIRIKVCSAEVVI